MRGWESSAGNARRAPGGRHQVREPDLRVGGTGWGRLHWPLTVGDWQTCGLEPAAEIPDAGLVQRAAARRST